MTDPSAGRKVGDLLDSLGVLAEFDETDIVPSALVLLKTVGDDGAVGLVIAGSEGLSWLDQFGMLEAARAIVAQTQFGNTDDEDD